MDSAVAQARPTGNLSNEWTYTSPEGIYFVGEGAVVAYVLSRGTVGANDSGSDKDSDTEVAAVTDKACEKIPQDRISLRNCSARRATQTRAHPISM
ncbi:hypothetical protein PC111_g3178 [Phytophthora cactorum]|nr:hypothetical protein PC111_g3178 [Phytophthora cactorum]